MIHRQRYWGLLISVMGGALGFFSPLLFPYSDAAITNWQITQVEKSAASSAIVVVELERDGPLKCGTQSWNRLALVDMMTALSEAHASVIAPLLSLSRPASPQCGGILGDAKLTESIHHDNIVISADSATFFTQYTKAMGHTDLGLDIDDVLRLMPSTTHENGKTVLPWGHVVSQTYKDQTSNGTGAYTNTLNTSGWLRWSNQTYTKFSDSQILALKESSISTLPSIVQDKIVVLIPKDHTRFLINTPFGEKIPAPYAHIEVLQNALSESTLRPVSTTFLIIVICILAWGCNLIIMANPLRMGLRAIVTLSLLYGTLMWGMLRTVGILLPILAPMMTICCTTALMGAWKIWSQQNQTRSRITNLEKKIAELKRALIAKEQRLASLALPLQTSAQTNGLPAPQLHPLQTSLVQAQRLWHEAQKEIVHSRRKLQELETQLTLLRRNQSPHIPEMTDTLEAGNQNLQQQCHAMGIVTRDPHILNIFADLKKAAHTSSPILLTGETGTGKEVFAKAVHRLSPHADGPLVAVNVAAIRPELFESELFGHARGAYTGAVGAKGFVETASHGTLFLDEIGEISMQAQAKLLRLLENQTYYRVGDAKIRTAHIRIVAATNRDLWHETQEGCFRADLYFRLNAFSFRIPPLRERSPEDRQLLVQYFIQNIAEQLGREDIRLSQGAMDTLVAAPWPGNLRELKHTLTQAATLTDNGLITEENLKIKSRSSHPSSTRNADDRAANEHLLRSTGHVVCSDDHTILAILREHHFDMQTTAKALQWDRSTVTQRLKGIGFQALVRHHGNIESASQELAGKASLAPRVRDKLRDYYQNLIPVHQQAATFEEALTDCRRRMKNLPDRYFTAVETLLRWSREAKAGELNPPLSSTP